MDCLQGLVGGLLTVQMSHIGQTFFSRVYVCLFCFVLPKACKFLCNASHQWSVIAWFLARGAQNGIWECWGGAIWGLFGFLLAPREPSTRTTLLFPHKTTSSEFGQPPRALAALMTIRTTSTINISIIIDMKKHVAVHYFLCLQSRKVTIFSNQVLLRVPKLTTFLHPSPLKTATSWTSTTARITTTT